MQKNWEEIPLEKCMERIIDYRGKTPKKTSSGVQLVTAKIVKNGRIDYSLNPEFIAEEDYDSWMVRGLPKKSDVVFTTEAPMGEVAQLDGRKVALAQRLITLRGKKGLLDNTFLKYLLMSREVQGKLKAHETGTTVTGIKQRELRKILLPLPPLPTQERIADILGTLDDKIELNRQMNRTLEGMARTIFKSWFVDFDPVYAKMEGRDYPLPAEVMDLFPDELVESELGLIPRGWEVGKLKEIIDFNPSYKLSKGTEATYLEMKSLPENGFFPMNWRKREFNSGTKFSNDDTLLARITPCLENGKTAFINFLNFDEIAWGSTEYIVMRTKGNIPHFYSYLLARDELFRNSAIQSMTGSSGRQRVQRDTLEELPSVIASTKIYSIFGEIILPMVEKMTINYLENTTLTEMRETLLPKLLSGEIETEK